MIHPIIIHSITQNAVLSLLQLVGAPLTQNITGLTLLSDFSTGFKVCAVGLGGFWFDGERGEVFGGHFVELKLHCLFDCCEVDGFSGLRSFLLLLLYYSAVDVDVFDLFVFGDVVEVDFLVHLKLSSFG